MGETTSYLAWNPAWTASTTNGELQLVAGLDHQFMVDGLSAETGLKVVAASKDQSQVSLIEPELLDHLVLLGIVHDTRLAGNDNRWVAVAGQPITLVEQLRAALKAGGFELSPTNSERNIDADPEMGPAITVWLRRRLDPTPPPPGIHLVVDTGNHHTIVFGPLVIPGRTACSECLDVRIGHRWPVVALPEQTQIERSESPLSALLALHLNLAFEGRSPLINGTSTFNTETGEGVNEALLKTALCERCTKSPAGQVELPWASRQASPQTSP